MAKVEHDLTDEQWSALQVAWAGCAYCGALDNIAPACGPCNASKCNDEVTGWLRRKRLDERAFLTRLVEIGASLE